MKKFLSIMLVAALAVTALALVGCDNPEQPQEGYTFVIPDGAPALGAVSVLNDVPDGIKSVEIVPSNTISQRAVQSDIAIVPANLAANLYNKGQDVKLVGTVTHGNLFVLGTTNSVKALADLEGKLVYSIGQNSVPDYVFRTLLEEAELDVVQGDAEQEGKVTINYKNDGSEVMQQLVAAKKEGKDVVGVLAEPAVTNAKEKGKMVELFNLQSLWQAHTGADATGYAQAVLIVKGDVAKDKAFMDRLIAAFEGNGAFVAEHSGEVAGIIAKVYPQSSFAAQTFTAETLERCNCAFTRGAACKAEFETMAGAIMQINAQAIGGKLPDAAFYYEG